MSDLDDIDGDETKSYENSDSKSTRSDDDSDGSGGFNMIHHEDENTDDEEDENPLKSIDSEELENILSEEIKDRGRIMEVLETINDYRTKYYNGDSTVKKYYEYHVKLNLKKSRSCYYCDKKNYEFQTKPECVRYKNKKSNDYDICYHRDLNNKDDYYTVFDFIQNNSALPSSKYIDSLKKDNSTNLNTIKIFFL